MLRTVFWISFAVTIVLFLSRLILKNLNIANESVFNKTSSGGLLDLPIINLLPLLFGFLCGWFVNSTYISDKEGKIIGFGKGVAVTFIRFAFLFIFGLLFGVLFLFLPC